MTSRCILRPILVIFLAGVIYICLRLITSNSVLALSLSGILLISGMAFILVNSTEKKVEVVFIWVGISLQPFTSYLLTGLGVDQTLASFTSIILSTLVLLGGLILSHPLANRIRKN